MFVCWLGCVDAPDEEGAIEAAANEFNIAEALRGMKPRSGLTGGQRR